MRRRLLPMVLVPVLFAGCGSAHSSSNASTRSPSLSDTASTTVTGGTTSTPTTPATPTSAQNTQTSSSSTVVQSSTTGRTSTRSQTPSNVRVPATFRIDAGETIVPASVSVPAGVPIQLTLISGDGRPHRAVVKLDRQRVLSVPAHGKVSVLLTGVSAGTYVIEVDGISGAGLLVGAQPGP